MVFELNNEYNDLSVGQFAVWSSRFLISFLPARLEMIHLGKGQHCVAYRLFSPRPAISLLLSWGLRNLTLSVWEHPSLSGFSWQIAASSPGLTQRLTNSSLLVPFPLWSTLSPQKCALTIKGQNNGLITCRLLSLSYPVLRGTQDASEFFSLFLIKISGWEKNSETCLSICSPNCVWAVASLHSATV